MAAVQPAGQQPSALVQEEIGAKLHAALQVAALPTSVSSVHALPSLQLEGQFPSHVSPESTMPSPQLGEQSLSVRVVQPGGQQPSPPVQAVMAAKAQAALQVDALPTSVSSVQALPSLQLSGQLSSHASPRSTTPSPHVSEQSSSFGAVQPEGQQPSPFAQAVIGEKVHTASQLTSEPCSTSEVHDTLSAQLVGQEPPPIGMARSQVSPAST